MLKIGLTGGIGSGKTAVAGIFSVLGIPVFFADAEARLAMEKDSALVQAIQHEFGSESYLNGALNRTFISGIVFNDSEKLKRLNAIVHPAAIAAAKAWMEQQKTPYAVKEAALLFESGSSVHLDYVIGVYAPQELRIKRVLARDSITREQVLLRINRQMDEDEKMKLCNFVLINDEQQLLLPQVLELHEKLLHEAETIN